MHYYSFEREIIPKDIEAFHYPNQKVGVLLHLENKKGEILLQQRALKPLMKIISLKKSVANMKKGMLALKIRL